MSEQKPTLKISKGEVATIKLESLKPFTQGEKEWDGVMKKWFGYNVTKDTAEYVYFTSESVHKLIQIAKPEGVFSLELRSVNNKEGQLRSIWYLNAKNYWQYEEQNALPDSAPTNFPKTDIVDPMPIGGTGPNPAGDKWRHDIEERLAKLEKEMYDNTVKTDENIPF